MLAVISIQTPFDPQALYTAFSFISSVFDSASWQNMVKMFFMIALINGIISVAIFQKTDYFKQFIVALAFSGILAAPVSDTLAISRSSTERVYTISNSKVPWVLVEGFTVINNVTRWFTNKAGANLNSPAYNGIYDAGIGSYGNIIRNSMDISFKNPTVKANLMQFFKECSLYDIRDGAININSLNDSGGGFGLLFSNTSPARFVTVNSTTGNSEVKTCTDAAQQLRNEVNYDTTKTTEEKGKSFFYAKDGAAPNMATAYYQAAIAATYQNQLNINNSMAAIMQQNMFNYLLEQTGQDFSRMLTDPALAENAAIHMATSRAAKKAAFQQSVIAQLGKELLPAMGSWIAIIIIMLFPFVILLFILAPLGNMLQVLFGYLGTLFWICLWQPIFAMINGLANWELGRQLAATGAFGKDGIPYSYVNAVYDSLINNQSLVGWLVLLTPVIASAVAFGTYKSLSSLGNSVMSTFSGTGTSVGNEMAEGNVSMGNSSYGNTSVGNTTRNNTSANKYDTNTAMSSGLFKINDAEGTTYTFGQGGYVAQNFDKDETNAELKANTTATATKGIGNQSATSFNKTQSTDLSTNESYGLSTVQSDRKSYGTTQSQGTSVVEGSSKNIQTGTTGEARFSSTTGAEFSQNDSNTGQATVGMNASTHLTGSAGVGVGGNGGAAGNPIGGAGANGKGNAISKLLGKGNDATKSASAGYINTGIGGTAGTNVGATEIGASTASSNYRAGDSSSKSLSDFQNINSTDSVNREKTNSNQSQSGQETSFDQQRNKNWGYSYKTGDSASLTTATSYNRTSSANESDTVSHEVDLSLPKNRNYPLDWLIGNGYEKEAAAILTDSSMGGKFTSQDGKADFDAYRNGGGLARLEASEKIGEIFAEKAMNRTSHTLNSGGNKPTSDAQNISNYNGEEKRLSQRYDKAESGFKVEDKTKRIQNDYSVRPNEKHADNVIKTGKANTRSLVSQTETGVGNTVQKYTKPNQQKNSVARGAGNLANGARAQEVLSLISGGDDTKKE